MAHKQDFLATFLISALVMLLFTQSLPNLLAATPVLTIETDEPSYKPGEVATIFSNLTQDGTPIDNALVGVQLKDPTGSPSKAIIRTLATGTNPQSPAAIEIIDTFPCDNFGNPVTSIARGEMIRLNTTIRNREMVARHALVAVSIQFSDEVFFTSFYPFNGTIEAEKTWSCNYQLTYMPTNAPLGTAAIHTSVLSDLPEQSGFPLCPEKTGSFIIVSSSSPLSLKDNTESHVLSVSGTCNFTFHIPASGEILGNYTIYASSFCVPFLSTAQAAFQVELPTDTNGDGKVDMLDLYAVALHFGLTPSDPRWNPNVDVDRSNLTDMIDLYLVALDFGKSGTYPPAPLHQTQFGNILAEETPKALPPPWLQVDPPSVLMGPEPCLSKDFSLNVKINELHKDSHAIAVAFKLAYDPVLLEVVKVDEGLFMQNPLWNLHGTFLSCNISTPPNPGVAICETLISPWDMTEYPNTIDHPELDNTIATITFRVIKQEFPFNYSCSLVLSKTPANWYSLDKDGNPIAFNEAIFIHGSYTIAGSPLPGRIADVYGGAENGHGPYPLPFPAPYGGQGSNAPMDLVIPQARVMLCASASYNFWPVQQVDVSFKVDGPYDRVYNETTQEWEYVPKASWMLLLMETARTNDDGIAEETFSMPWPCTDPESVLGIWKTLVTVTIRDKIVNDTLYFHYDYMVHIWNVATDKTDYAHGETAQIEITYGTHSAQYYPAVFSAVIRDNLDVPVGFALVSSNVGGADSSNYKNSTIHNIYILIPKFAYAGVGHVQVICFDEDPLHGGSAWCPQYEPLPEIFIQPR